MNNLSIFLSESHKNREILQQKNSFFQAIFTLSNIDNKRHFLIQSNAPFQTKFNDENQRQRYQKYLPNPREISELQDYPTLNSNHIWFDALYALAIEEVRQCSVSSISDGSYNNGQPMGNTIKGGFFDTGLFWTYVWTRDIAYSLDLSLANLDPIRALNSLNFKLSERRSGGNLQIIQDTGTGGSYPISSDRVVWSLGSRALLKQLNGEKKNNFAQRSYEALKNTIEHDRIVIFDKKDGLYRGEQSFLDWREQSYPYWTAHDPVQIGMSKALSTNCCHFHALDYAAFLAGELGYRVEQRKYNQWAQQLKQAIRTHLYLPEQHLYSTFITSTFAPGPAHQYDLLGNALAILLDIADMKQGQEIVAHYPQFPLGPSVIWPQQRDTLIYHNQGMWPFATAYWLKAAKKVKNAQAVTLSMSALVRGAALSLSNMENFDAVSGQVEIDSENKEPQVNSPRQLWSVAGYISMIHDIIFGITWTDSGLHIAPYITREFRHYLLPNSHQLVLNNLYYRNHQLNITLNLPPLTEEIVGTYHIKKIRLHGNVVTSNIPESMLSDRNQIEVDLGEGTTQQSSINLVSNLDNYQYRFAPRPPIVESIYAVDNQLEIQFNINKENPNDVTINVYRDGVLVAKNLSGNRTRWRDTDSQENNTPSYCYNLEAVYINSGNTSQRSAPFCYWGLNSHRIYGVNANEFAVVGGTFSSSHGRDYYDHWGAPEDTITVNIQAQFTGSHAIQVIAGNGSGPISTGINCAVKHLQMKNLGNNQIVADGYLMMPQLGTWERWLESSVIFTNVDLIAQETYEIIIFEDEQAINMSSFIHNETYNSNRVNNHPFNYVNIAQINLNSLTN